MRLLARYTTLTNPSVPWSMPEGIEKVQQVVELAEARERGKGGKKVELKPVPETGKGEAKNREGTKDGDEEKVDSNKKLGKPVTLQSRQSWRAKTEGSKSADAYIYIRMTVVTPEKLRTEGHYPGCIRCTISSMNGAWDRESGMDGNGKDD